MNLDRFLGQLAPDGTGVGENFARWFGPSVLKNEDGPLVLFRGDRSRVDVFDPELRRETGIFLAAEKSRAAVYGDPHPYFVRMENPLDLREVFSKWMSGGVVRFIVDDLFETYYEGDSSPETGEAYTVSDVITGIEEGFLWSMDGTGGFTMNAWRALQDSTVANGFDGLVVHDTGEGLGKGVSYVAFDQHQLKSARENLGLFSSDNPSVRDDPAVLRAVSALKQIKEAATSTRGFRL